LNLKVSEKSKWHSKSDKDFSQYSIPGISHRDVLVSSVSVVPLRSRPKIYEFRNFKGINVEQLKQAASEFYWGPFYSLDHVDDKVEFCNDVILALYNRLCSVTY
jgi:hypothetical protein